VNQDRSRYDRWRMHHFPRRRPRWWPEGDPWPPIAAANLRQWRKVRRGFLLRLGLMFLSVLLIGGVACGMTLWLLGGIRFSTSGTSLLPLLLTVLGIVVVAGLIPGMRSLALPLRDLIDASSRVETGDLDVQVAERGPRELRSLARSFNAMVNRLRADESQRDRLLADVTHELRTPLAVIQGNLEAMIDGVYPADEDHLAPVLEETRVLSRLIDDLRTLSLAESGALELHREPTDVAVLAGEVVAAFRSNAEAAGVSLVESIAEDLPLIDIDPLRVREVLSNLTSNALRHTPSGGSVRLEAVVNGDEREMVLSVVDTGRGIAANELPHVFDRFAKSPDSPGTGLGLAIAKNLVEAHGGQITAESAVGKGTTVRFTLPIGRIEA
jgi:signal transduction histidine kinase